MTCGSTDLAGKTITTNIGVPAMRATNVGDYDQFQGGRVTFVDAGGTETGTREIDSSSVNANGFRTVTFKGTFPNGSVSIKNLDDDDIDPAVGSVHIGNNGMQINFDNNMQTFIQARYTPACVRIDSTKIDLSPTAPALDVNQNNVAFSTYIWNGRVTDAPNHLQSGKDFIAANKESRCTADFWVIYMCGAFQLGPMLCNDPNRAAWVNGYTYAPGITGDLPPADDAHSGLLLFYETMRDMKAYTSVYKIPADVLPRAVLTHETGHMWGLNHTADAGSIMLPGLVQAQSQNAQDNLIFSGESLRTIIQSEGPGRPE
jgi:hypothetical protein